MAYSQFTASLAFPEDTYRTLDQQAMVVTLGRKLGKNWLLRASLVRVLGGEMNGGGVNATLDPGWSFGVQASRRWSVDDLPSLFLGFSVSFAGSFTTAQYAGGPTHDLFATDLRLGGTVGWTLFDAVTPYVAARLFGGPVFWHPMPDGEQEGGSDRYHVKLAAGLSANLPAGFYLSAEYAPVGELGMSAELGVRF